jgi:hypothetical protein
MENTFEHATALIGKTPDDQEFRQFVEDIGEVPVVGPRIGRVYVFANSGFSLHLYEGTFRSVTFHLPSASREHRPAYSGDLPGGLQQEDSDVIMRQKIAVHGCKFMSHEETYHLPDGRILSLEFDADHQLDELTVT